MKKLFLLLLITFEGALFAQQEQGKIAETDLQNSSWYKEVQKNIQKREYNLSFSEKLKAYQSPNRRQNLRFIYSENGFTAQPRMTKIPLFDVNDRSIKEDEKTYQTIENWEIKFSLQNYGRKSNLQTFGGKELKVNENRAEIEDENLRITYKNTEEGMRQDFIGKRKPEGKGNLQLRIGAASNLKMRVGGETVAFANDKSEDKMKYFKLKVWDKNERPLTAYFEKISANKFAIVVND